MADSWFDDGDVAYAFGDSYDDQAGNDDNNNDDERDDDDFSYAFATWNYTFGWKYPKGKNICQAGHCNRDSRVLRNFWIYIFCLSIISNSSFCINTELHYVTNSSLEIRTYQIFSKQPEVPIPSFHEVSMRRQALVWRDWPSTGSAQDTMMQREVVLRWFRWRWTDS